MDFQTFKSLLDSSDNIVFFGGAGVSTESGIPDFRSASGLYHEPSSCSHAPEEILSHDLFMAHTEAFYRFYRSKIIHADAKPNAAHVALARLEKAGKLKTVITQNIDGLHQMAGCQNVLELHGSLHRNTCMKCGATYLWSGSYPGVGKHPVVQPVSWHHQAGCCLVSGNAEQPSHRKRHKPYQASRYVHHRGHLLDGLSICRVGGVLQRQQTGFDQQGQNTI